MDNREGKRVLTQEAAPRRGKAGLIAGIVVAAGLCAGYAGLCAAAGTDGTLLPNTAAAGVELGGMKSEEAAAALEEQLAARMDALSVEFRCGENNYAVPLSEFTVNTGGAVQELAAGQAGPFLSRGVRMLAALAGRNEREVSVTLDHTPLAVAQAVAEGSDPNALPSWETDGTDLRITKGRTGRTVDTGALMDALTEEAGRLINGGDPAGSAPIEAQVATAPPVSPDFDAIYDEIYQAPADARLDAETKEIVPSVTGLSFDKAQAQALLDRAEEGSVVSIPLIMEEPAITTELLNERLFADVLGSSTTSCAGPANRWYNIDLAASRCNNVILLPGEEFSYNDHAGPYTLSSGYREAGTYQNGQSIDATAGGICQLSSTLYWTTLKANLEIVERNKHKFNGGYMPVIGTDATVWSNTLDFRFKNNTEYPIKITCYQDKNHNLTVTIYGTDTTGIHGEPYSVVISTVAYQNTYQPDPSIPAGSEPVRDTNYSRYNGYTVDLYQKLVDKSGNVVSNTFLYRNTYAASNAVYHYNPADAARLGIDTSTGLRTLTPVVSDPEESTPPEEPSSSPAADPEPTPTPSASAEPTPLPTPTPLITPIPQSTPAPVSTPEPIPVPEPTPPPAPSTGPGMMPEDPEPLPGEETIPLD